MDQVGLPSRRRLLKAVAGSSVVLAGCTQLDPSRNDENGTDDGPDDETDFETIASSPTCATADADWLFRVDPRGALVILETNDRADDVYDIVVAERGIDEKRVRQQSIEVDGETRYVIELDPATESIGTLRELFEDGDGVHAVREGQSYTTVNAVAKELAESLEETEDLQPDQAEINVVQPDPPDALYAIALLSGVDSAAVLENSESFETSIETDSGEKELTGSDGIVSVGTETVAGESTHGVTITLSEEAQQQYIETLDDVGALDPGSRDRLVVYYAGERISDGILADGLKTALRSGDWDGSFVISTRDESKADELVQTLNLVTFSIPSDVTIDDCSRM